jgi:hypothetical protein
LAPLWRFNHVFFVFSIGEQQVGEEPCWSFCRESGLSAAPIKLHCGLLVIGKHGLGGFYEAGIKVIDAK